jgi:hypothetical protein
MWTWSLLASSSSNQTAWAVSGSSRSRVGLTGDMHLAMAPRVEFFWEGFDECDPAEGRGWALVEQDGSLRGHIFFHLGDDSSFRVTRTGHLERKPVRGGRFELLDTG